MSKNFAWLGRNKTLVAAICAALMLIGGWLSYNTRSGHNEVAQSQVASSISVIATPSGDAGAFSIMVLPLTNQTGDPQKISIADALTTALTADLSRIAGLYVAPSATAFALRDNGSALPEAASSAGVRFVLQGSLVSTGNTVRIGVQLVNAVAGVTMQSANFEGDTGNMYALQTQVTELVGNSIAPGARINQPTDNHTVTFGARAADLRMSAMSLRLNPPSLDNWQQIESLHRQVLKLEPNNPLAMSDLAYCLAVSTVDLLFSPNTDQHREQRLQEAQLLASKALPYDLDNANAHTALGLVAQSRGDWANARRAFEKKVVLEPKDAESYRLLGEVLIVLGETPKAVEALRQANALNPKGTNHLLFYDLGVAFFNMGDNDAAIVWMEKALDSNPNETKVFAFLAMAYANKGDKARTQEWATWASASPYKLSAFNPPTGNSPAAYREIWAARMVSSWQIAGLPL